MPPKPPTSSSISQSRIARRNFIARIGALVAGGALFGRVAKAADAPPVRTLGGDPWIGEIALVAFNFPPRGWAMCDGQLLAISQNTALFSLLGTTYGGDGRTNFALPDLRGRVPMHQGQGPGLATRYIGEQGGEEAHSMSVSEMPIHTHGAQGSSAIGTSDSPVGGVPARSAAGTPEYAAAPNASLAASAIGNAGGGTPHNNLQPYLTLNYVIALQGIYPSSS